MYVSVAVFFFSGRIKQSKRGFQLNTMYLVINDVFNSENSQKVIKLSEEEFILFPPESIDM